MQNTNVPTSDNMNLVMDSNTAPIELMNTFYDKMYDSADLEPLPLCVEIVKSENAVAPNPKKSKVIRIPCRARGVCDTHTPSSAYFEISEDCPHGRILTCSHKLCRDSGRQFRYCRTCDQVTAKRNFSKRHAHGITKRSPKQIDDSTPGSKKRKVTLEDAEAESLASLLQGAMQGDDASTSVEDSTVDVPSTVYAPKDASGSTKLMMVTKQEANLLELVRSQPSNENAVDHWINQILLATDPIVMRREDGGLGDEILSDSEEELHGMERMPSLDRFNVFTESFDCLYLK